MKPRYLFILAVICALVSIVALRYNSQTAANLRANILEKDKAGQDVSADIAALRKFVFAHMNSSIRLELTSSYERAVAAAQAASRNNPSGELYAQAQAACDRPGVSSVAQAQCVQEFLSGRLQPGTNPQPAQLPDRSLFNYVFISPTWTADLAGWALLGALATALAALVIYIVNAFRGRQTSASA